MYDARGGTAGYETGAAMGGGVWVQRGGVPGTPVIGRLEGQHSSGEFAATHSRSEMAAKPGGVGDLGIPEANDREIASNLGSFESIDSHSLSHGSVPLGWDQYVGLGFRRTERSP